MEIIKINSNHPLANKIDKCDWNAAKFLAKLLKNNQLTKVLGANSLVFVLMDNDNLVSFLTLSDQDCIIDPTKKCWIGFVYTDVKYRGNRYSELLINVAINVAKINNHNIIYLATNHIGLYEKYGFEYLESKIDVYGELSRIYFKKI